MASANKRKKLEEEAAELGIEFTDETSDQDLATQIQAELEDDEPQVPKTSGSKKFYKTSTWGLAVALSSNDSRSEVGVDEVRFRPFQLRNEQTGDIEKFGLLATEDPDVIEAVAEDHTVQEIDEDLYADLISTAESVPY